MVRKLQKEDLMGFSEVEDQVLSDWLPRGSDGFGLPLVGTLFGFRSLSEQVAELLPIFEATQCER